jgi:hypothetical protein
MNKTIILKKNAQIGGRKMHTHFLVQDYPGLHFCQFYPHRNHTHLQYFYVYFHVYVIQARTFGKVRIT